VEIAYVLINCELGSEKAILESLKHIDSVTEVHGTFGAYDIITKIEAAIRLERIGPSSPKFK